MEKFVRVTGTAAPMLVENIDTDAIIPVPWMTKSNVDYGQALFANRRYVDGDGVRERPDFILNRAPFRQARILVGGANFGCGSSREHAVWALLGFGIRAVIAPSYSDIFYGNSFKSGLLPVILPAETVQRLGRLLEEGKHGHEMTVDLEACTVTAADGSQVSFGIDPARRTALLEGLDEIGLTLKDAPAIAAFQARDRAKRPWIYDAGFNAR
ncbi:MAG: 3-isopropylmalate dehydratase small subunit [Rhodospirillaceae bacterium]|nr:3-isopropylmalate dehydratase small subunit [Rhodospirillaceae bacterium]